MSDITAQFSNILNLHKSEVILMSDLLDMKEKYLLNSVNLLKKDLAYCQQAKKFHASKAKMLDSTQKILTNQSQNINEEVKQLEIVDDIETNKRASIIREQSELNQHSAFIIAISISNNKKLEENLDDAEDNAKTIKKNNDAAAENLKKEKALADDKKKTESAYTKILADRAKLAVAESKTAGSTTKQLLDRREEELRKYHQGINAGLDGKIFGDKKWTVIGNELLEGGEDAAKLLGMGIRDKVLEPFKKIRTGWRAVKGFFKGSVGILKGIFTSPWSEKGKAEQKRVQNKAIDRLDKQNRTDQENDELAAKESDEYAEKSTEYQDLKKSFMPKNAQDEKSSAAGAEDTNSSIDEVEKIQSQTEYQEKVISLLSIIAGQKPPEGIVAPEAKKEESSGTNWMDLLSMAFRLLPRRWQAMFRLFKGKLGGMFRNIAGSIKNGFKNVFGKVGSFFSNVTSKIGSGFKSFFGSIGNGIKGVFNGAKNLIGSAGRGIVNVAKSGANLAVKAGKGIAGAAKTAAKVASRAGGALLKGGLRLGANALKAVPGLGLLATAGMAIWDGIDGWNKAAEISGKKEEDLTTTDKVMASTASVLSGLTFGLVDAQTMFKGVEWLKDMSIVGTLEKLDETASQLTGKAKEDLTFMDKTKSFMADTASKWTFGLISTESAFGAIDKATNFISEGVSTAVDNIKSFGSNIWAGVEGACEFIADPIGKGKDLLASGWNAVQNIGAGVTEKVSGFVSGITGFLSDVGAFFGFSDKKTPEQKAQIADKIKEFVIKFSPKNIVKNIKRRISEALSWLPGPVRKFLGFDQKDLEELEKKAENTDDLESQIVAPSPKLTSTTNETAQNNNVQSNATNITNNSGMSDNNVKQIVDAINNQKPTAVPVFVQQTKGPPPPL